MPREAVILPPTECACPKANHQHGTYTMYKKDGCRCQPCSDAMWRKNKQSVIRRQRGLTVTSVPAHTAIAHVRALRTAGMPLTEAARVSGIALSTLDKLHQGHLERIYTTTEAKILAIQPPVVPAFDSNRVHIAGTQRRIRALIAVGHTIEDISRAAGLEARNLSKMSSPGATRQWVEKTTAEKVHAAYDVMWDQVSDTSTPARRSAVGAAMNKAAKHGWLPPLAWDDDRIDDPTYTPNVVGLRAPHPKTAEGAKAKLDELEYLVRSGEPVTAAALRAGYPTLKAAREAANHQGRLTLAHRLNPEENAA